MTLQEAASEFRRANEYAPWLQAVGVADHSHGDATQSRLVCYTVFALPEPLKERLAPGGWWLGWPMEFRTSGRICLE